MKIKCIKNVVMVPGGDIAFIRGRTYDVRVEQGVIQSNNEQGSTHHVIKGGIAGERFYFEHFTEKWEENNEIDAMWSEEYNVSTGALIIRNCVFNLVDEERNRQDSKWGTQDHSQQAWVGILGEEFGEYCQAVNETYLNNATKKHEGGYDRMMTELTHVAAVAVGAIESLMRNRED